MAANFNSVAEAVEDGRLRVEDMNRAIAALPNEKNIDIIINAIATLNSNVGGHAAAMAQQTLTPNAHGYAAGGISTGPASGHMELLHGTEAVIPLQNGSIPVQMSAPAGMGGGNTTINVKVDINSPMTVLDRQTALNTIGPLIVESVREARSRGAL
jgi:hypothetical protein